MHHLLTPPRKICRYAPNFSTLPQGEGEATAPPPLRAPLIGRDAELAVLRRAARAALDKREVRAVTLVGGPGIGKARIVEEFLGAFMAEFPSRETRWRRKRSTPLAASRNFLRAHVRC